MAEVAGADGGSESPFMLQKNSDFFREDSAEHPLALSILKCSLQTPHGPQIVVCAVYVNQSKHSVYSSDKTVQDATCIYSFASNNQVVVENPSFEITAVIYEKKPTSHSNGKKFILLGRAVASIHQLEVGENLLTLRKQGSKKPVGTLLIQLDNSAETSSIEQSTLNSPIRSRQLILNLDQSTMDNSYTSPAVTNFSEANATPSPRKPKAALPKNRLCRKVCMLLLSAVYALLYIGYLVVTSQEKAPVEEPLQHAIVPELEVPIEPILKIASIQTPIQFKIVGGTENENDDRCLGIRSQVLSSHLTISRCDSQGWWSVSAWPNSTIGLQIQFERRKCLCAKNGNSFRSSLSLTSCDKCQFHQNWVLDEHFIAFSENASAPLCLSRNSDQLFLDQCGIEANVQISARVHSIARSSSGEYRVHTLEFDRVIP